MKIDPNKTILNVAEMKKAPDHLKNQKSDFDTILRQAVGIQEAEKASVEGVSLAADIRPAKFTIEPQPSFNVVKDRIQELINAMEAYQRKLTERGASVKDIDPLVNRMATQSESLSAVSSTVEDQDELRKLMNQSLILSSMEIAKFKSGFYND